MSRRFELRCRALSTTIAFPMRALWPLGHHSSKNVAEAAGIEPAHQALPGLSVFKAGALPLCQTSEFAPTAFFGGRSAINWCQRMGSNHRRPRLQRGALPTELLWLETVWRSMLDSNQRANSRRPRLSKPAPWTTRPMLLILGAHSVLDSVHRECDLPHARRRLDLLPMWAEKTSSIRLCPRAMARIAAVGFNRCTTGATWCTWRPCPALGSIEGGIS